MALFFHRIVIKKDDFAKINRMQLKKSVKNRRKQGACHQPVTVLWHSVSMKNPIDMADRAHDAMAANAPSASAPAVDASRPPVKAPEHAMASEATVEAKASEKNSQPESHEKQLKWLGIPLPEKVSNSVYGFNHWIDRVRNKTIRATPSVLVNHSTNLVSAMHLTSEMMMFKASAKEDLVSDKSKWVNYIVEPPQKIVKEVFGGAGNSDLNVKELMQGNPASNVYRRLTDTKAATEREVHKQMEAGVSRSKVSLPNRWQMRSTAVGLVAWGLNLVLPDRKDTPEGVEKMTRMSVEHPAQYALLRVKQALWVPGWADHKRQMTGLGVMISGVCSTLGAWRNRESLNTAEGIIKNYKYNSSYMMTGLITLASSVPMIFEVDNDRGYTRFGAIHLLRCFFLPTSIGKKYAMKEDGANWYTAGAVGFQAENAVAALIGGAEKRADGSIVDHKSERLRAKEHARAAKAERRSSKQKSTAGHFEGIEHAIKAQEDALPTAQVSQAMEVMRAMPERTTTETVATV